MSNVVITVVPGLPHPFAWWSEDHILALRPCAAEELPEVLEKVVEHIRGSLQVVQDRQVQQAAHTWRPIGDGRCTTCGSYLVTLSDGETHCARCEQRDDRVVAHWLPSDQSTAYLCCGARPAVGDRAVSSRDDVTCPSITSLSAAES